SIDRPRLGQIPSAACARYVSGSARSLSFVSMPTYDYRCPNGHDFEHFYRKISDAAAELACPTCGALAQRRVSGGAGLVFKGSGFYLTDYGKNAHRQAAPAPTT